MQEVPSSGSALPSGPAGTRSVWVEREAYLMGTTLRVRVAASQREAGIAAIEAVFAEVRRLDDLLSTWRDDTELARLNRSPIGVPLRASPELLSLLLEARAWSLKTGGAFDPTVGPLIEVWDLRAKGRRPSAAELRRAVSASGVHGFTFDADAGVIRRLDPAAWIDEGAFGKGAALRAARESLLGSGIRSALLDFGGQLVAVGSEESGRGWMVGVAHPSRRDEPAALIRLGDASAATTSDSERFVEVAGERIGHILDPRTGLPVAAWGSVTVVAEDPVTADVLSTALFVLGPTRAMSWVRDHEGVAVLFLEETERGLRARWNDAMAPLLVWIAGKESDGAGEPGRGRARAQGGEPL